MPFIPPQYLFILLGASETVLALFKRSGASAKGADQGSFGGLWIVIGASIFCSIFISKSVPGTEVAWSDGLYRAGALLFAVGLFLRWWSIIHLGRFFTVNVAIASDHRVVDNGPYRLLRHPSYTGALTAFCGLGLLLFNWLAALVLVLPVLIMFLWRIQLEERALEQALGEDYTAYMARTKRLVPFVY